ncbi:MAG: thiamine pyrophosphate-dependent dehydrogenase E1 component subunit alpha, partial [Thermaerobacter sp.]|nr:thiamine pyrophosphate-dependent dehydrogenase E1 component subunit alpha [Thermaerobacter sp.]
RSKSTFLARGVPPDMLLAEIMGRQSGLCGGVGGEIHAADISRGIFGSTGIVGGALPIALGAAFKQMYHQTGGIAVCGFGDGATTQGSFHESLNLAALWNLPLVFICENNFFSEMTPLHKEMKEVRIAHKAQAYGMPGRDVDGYDLDAVHGVLTEAADLARNGGGPSLIEVKTYRWHGHYEGDPELYRDPAETLKWRARDPVRTLRDRLKSQAVISAAGLLAIEQDVEERLSQAVHAAQASPFPSSHSLTRQVYADPRAVPGGEEP